MSSRLIAKPGEHIEDSQVDQVVPTVDVILVSDRGYHELSEFAIAALALNHSAPLHIHLYRDGYEAELNAKLHAYLAARGHSFATTSLPADMQQPGTSQLHSHITRATLMKANAIELHSERAHRIVFLDGDVLTCRSVDLASVFSFQTTAAAVFDFVSYMSFDDQRLVEHTTRQGISSDYLNAGVLFIDAVRWRERDCFRRFIEYVERHAGFCPYRHDATWLYAGDCKGADQCALNMTLENDWTPLDFTWNVQKTLRHTAWWRSAKLRHYTGFRKFLAASNVNRDRLEARLLREISRRVGLQPSQPVHYDQGLMFMADTLKYWKETRAYQKILHELRHQLEQRRKATASGEAKSG